MVAFVHQAGLVITASSVSTCGLVVLPVGFAEFDQHID
jgi:hypothetical protein